MKNWMTTLSFLIFSFSASANQIDKINLISNMNYGMDALSVTMVKNKVVIIIENAILNYADNQEMLDKRLNNKMEKTFGMNDINALKITFNAEDCRQNTNKHDIFECTKNNNSESSITVQALKIGSNNVVSKASSIILDDNSVSVRTAKMRETDASNSEYDSFKAWVEIDSLGMNNEKSNLGR